MSSNTAVLPEIHTTPAADETQRLAMSPPEVSASLRVLVYFAQSPGALSHDEQEVLENAFKSIEIPAGPALQHLMETDVDLDEQLKKIVSREARERTYNAVYCVAHAEGPCSPARQKLLDYIRDGLNIPPEKATLLGRIYADAHEWIVPGNINSIGDTAERATAIHEYVLKFSIISAVIGSLPVVSIVPDMLVVTVQVKMVRDIGQYWGHKVDRDAARSIVAGALGATGMRIAVHSLLSLVPILGSAMGAASAFVTTWALGSVANSYFASDGTLSREDMRELYEIARRDARAIYEKSKILIPSGHNSPKKDD